MLMHELKNKSPFWKIYMRGLAFTGVSIFLCFTTLYYYLRFQFDLVNIIPILQYVIAYVLITAMIFYIAIFRANFIYNKMDILIFFFFLNNTGFIPLSFYRYGVIEGLYATKNYMTTIFLYFIVVVFFDAIQARKTVKLIAVLCALVSLVYVLEMASIRYAPIEMESFILNSQGPFKYSVLLDEYAKKKAPEGHGVSKSWRRSETSMYIRMPGPLGHSSATALIMGIGVILSYSMMIFGQGKWKKYSLLLFFLCLTGLMWGASRTNMAGALTGIAIISISGVALKYVSLKKTLIIMAAAVFFIASLMLLSIIDLSAYRQVVNIEQTIETFRHIVPKTVLVDCFHILLRNPIGFLFGYGLPPVLSQTFSTPAWTGVPFASDDAFYIQIISQYGILGNLLYIAATIFILYDSFKLFSSRDKQYINDHIFAIIGIIAVIAATFISTVHAASAIRPQVSPVIFILLASYSVIIRRTGQ